MSSYGSNYSIYYDLSDEWEDALLETNQSSTATTTTESTDSVKPSVNPSNDFENHSTSANYDGTGLNKVFLPETDMQQATQELKTILMNPQIALGEGNVENVRLVHESAQDQDTQRPVYTQILLTGANASSILECALKQIRLEDETPPYEYIVSQKMVESFNGTSVDTFIKAVLLDSPNNATQTCMLVLENLNENHILDIHRNEFIRKTMLQIQPGLAFIIFVNPLLNNVTHFQEIGAKIIVSGSTGNYHEERLHDTSRKMEVQVENDAIYATDTDTTASGTISNDDLDTPDTQVIGERLTPTLAFESLCSPSSLNETTCKAMDFITEKDISKMETVIVKQPEPEISVGRSNGYEEVKNTSPCQSVKYEKPNQSCFLKIVRSTTEVIAQCGDCCFY